MEPSTPPQMTSVPATSPYGSPDSLSSMPGPLSPESPLQTILVQQLPASSQYAVDITPCKLRPATHEDYEDENESIARHSDHTCAIPGSSMESKSGVFLPSESSPPPEFQPSPKKQPVLNSVQEQEDSGTGGSLANLGESIVQRQEFLNAGVSSFNTKERDIQEPNLGDDYLDLLALPTIAESPPVESFQAETFTMSSSPPQIPSTISSTATTPGGPAAKRRRLNSSIMATNKLMRPFKSPLKPNNTMENATTASLETPQKYPPSTPPRKTALPYTPLPRPQKPVEETDIATEVTKSITPAVLHPRSAKSTIKSKNPPFRSSFSRTAKLNISSPASLLSKDPYILSLEQKLAQLQSSVQVAKRLLEDSSQALKIEQSGEDDKLEELILKWRLAAQNAADHMFVGAEQRFQRMGGMAGHRERQNRSRSGGGWGFANEDPEEGLSEEQKEARRLAMYEAGFDEISELEKQQNETKDNSKEDGDHFTMDMMLASLNIDIDIIGYDKQLQRWGK